MEVGGIGISLWEMGGEEREGGEMMMISYVCIYLFLDFFFSVFFLLFVH